MPDPEKIKRNLAKMVAAGAKPEEIDAYMQSQGLKPADKGDEFKGSGGGTSWPEGSALNPLARGALFGIPMVDEMGGVISKLTGGTYRAGRDDIHAREAEYRERNPGMDLALELGAGITSGLGAVRALGKGVARQIIKRGPLAVAGRGAVAGAATGAVAGAAGADGSAVARARSAIAPAAIGAVGGGAIPGLTTAVGRVGRAGLSAVSRGQARRRSDDLMLDALERSKGSLDNVNRWGSRVAAMGDGAPPAMMIDAGRATQGRGRFVAMSPSRGQERLMETLDRRVMDQPGRVASSAEGKLGVNAAGVENADDVIRGRQVGNARQAYRQAYEHGPILNPQVRETLGGMLDDPVFRDAWDRGRRLATLVKDDLPDGVPLSDGTAPTVRLIDYFKKGLDATIQSRRGSSSALTRSEATAYRNRLNELLAQVDDEVPAYREARAGWGAESELLEAFEVGTSALDVPSREIRELVRGMTPEQRETARIGLARALRDQMAKGKDGADMTRRVFGSPETRARLRPFFPNSEAYRRFQQEMMAEARIAQSRNAVNSGSRTAPMVGEAADVLGANLGEAASVMANPASAPWAAFKAGAGRIAQGANENIADELADALQIQPGTQKFSQYMQRMGALNRRRQSARSRQIVTGAGVGAAGNRMTGN